MSTTTLPVAPGEAAEVKTCCGDLWSHPAVQLLAGDAFRPGGVSMTAELIESLDLGAGALVLDIGSGTGATLRWLSSAGHHPVGIDYSDSLARLASTAGPVSRADAEALPFADNSFDVVLVECVVSVLPDKSAALAEMHRVLRPEGRLVMSDVTVAGDLPPELDNLLGWAACASGAMPRADWLSFLSGAGFVATRTHDHRPELMELVAQGRRRLALLQGAVAAEIIPEGLHLGPFPGIEQALPGAATMSIEDGLAFAQGILTQIAAAVDTADLGYVSLIGSPV